MGKVKIELNRDSVGQLLKSAEMQGLLEEHASKMANKSGGEYEIYVASTRAVARVKTNAKDNTLLKAVR